MIAALLLAAAPALPEYMKVPANPDTLHAERYGQAMLVDEPENVEKRGRHWSGTVILPEAKDKDHAPLWAPLKKQLLAQGWTIHKEFMETNPAFATVRFPKKNAWASFALFGWDDVRFDVIEEGEYHSTFALKKPAPKPEAVVAGKDFPWLTPPPGSTFSQDVEDSGSFTVQEKGQDEVTIISEKSVGKEYQLDPAVSNLELVTLYHDAFTRAGWRIAEESQGISQGDVVMTAQYAKDGRNIWAYLHGGGELLIKIADVGANDLAAALEKECHVALSGLNFDFNKATLKPESEPVLEKVASLLGASPKLVVEVQGHTDNVGGDAFNQKLSEQRAETVRAWLVTHKIDTKRLSAKGYGKGQPVADNGSTEGRAKNRRVELRRSGCK